MIDISKIKKSKYRHKLQSDWLRESGRHNYANE